MTRPADLPKEYLIDIGQRIRGQRKRLNLTQQQAAELLGVSPNFYGKVERGIPP
ncbi:MAG: helix-turn-helix transcriptional regulator [Clostridiales bacterium]|nr:helix-turn-helix transcriptional regulator [Clostridiales bacterium]